MSSPLIRFFVYIVWQSGHEKAYCAAAETADEAKRLPIMGRASDVVLAEAWPWPEELGGPPAAREQRAYVLKSAKLIKETLDALRPPERRNSPTPPWRRRQQ